LHFPLLPVEQTLVSAGGAFLKGRIFKFSYSLVLGNLVAERPPELDRLFPLHSARLFTGVSSECCPPTTDMAVEEACLGKSSPPIVLCRYEDISVLEPPPSGIYFELV
jgi:hypothetical protein